MAQPNQLGTLEPSFINRNRATGVSTANPYSVPKDYQDIASLDARLLRVSSGKLATAVASGSTTTMVINTNDVGYLAVGQTVDIYDNTDTVKAGGTGKSITTIGSDSAGRTTITFTTAASGATAAGDYFKLTTNPYAGAYSQATLNKMTVNDKLAAVRFHNDPNTI